MQQPKTAYTSKMAKMRDLISRSLLKLPRSSRSEIINKSSRNSSNEAQYTWWTKFYNSLTPTTDLDRVQKHSLIIFDSELENNREFRNLHDWAEPVALLNRNGQKKGIQTIEKPYAVMKINVKVQKTLGNGQFDEKVKNKM